MILNMDDKYFKYFSEKSKKKGLKVLTFSKKNPVATFYILT